MQPCRSPYCECTKHKCTHPGFYDARHIKFNWKGNQMDSFDNRLKQILNMFSIDADTGIPDFILAKFLCRITDTLTTSYQELPDNENIGDIKEESTQESSIVNQFAEALSELREDVRRHSST